LFRRKCGQNMIGQISKQSTVCKYTHDKTQNHNLQIHDKTTIKQGNRFKLNNQHKIKGVHSTKSVVQNVMDNINAANKPRSTT